MRLRRRGERGSALVIVLVLTVLLTVLGAAMVSLTLTEVTIAYNQEEGAGALQAAEAGIARAVYELSQDSAWTGTGGPVTVGTATYDVTVAALGSPSEMVRFIQSTGTQGGGREHLTATVKVIPRSALAPILANTTATIGAASSGLTVRNLFPPATFDAVHANNALGAITGMTVNTAGATVIGGLLTNGVISGVNCATWPWRCSPFGGTLPVPDLDTDSGSGASYRSRAIAARDPAGSANPLDNLYFRGGDPQSRCTNTASGYAFGLGQTQRCWDKYVHSRYDAIQSRTILGAGITDPVYYVAPSYFGTGEPTSYTVPTLAPTYRSDTAANSGGATSLTISRPAGVVANDVLIAAVGVRGGVAITGPAGWTLVRDIWNGGTTIRMAVYYKVATASEPASYTWTWSTTQKAAGGIIAFDNVDPIAPIEAEDGQPTPSGTSHATPTITTYSSNIMLVASFSVAFGTTWTPPPGMTEQYETAGGGGTSSRITTSGNTQVQTGAAAGATWTRTATSGNAAEGAAHLLALRGDGTRVDCAGNTAARNALCVRAVAAVSPDNFTNSRPDTITGTAVVFGRGSGTVAYGDVLYESLGLRAADFTHRAVTADPVLIAGGRVTLISTGTPAASRQVEITGIVLTFAGQDNPSGGFLAGSSAVGIDVQHGAALVTLTFNGILVSNGSILVRDTVLNSGTVTVQYDAAVIDNLPAAFLPAPPQDNAVLFLSWSSAD